MRDGSLHTPSAQSVTAGSDTREGSDARQRSMPAVTPTAAPLPPPSVEQPATDARPPRASVATIHPIEQIHQAARDAAAETAYPRERYGAKVGTTWGAARPVVIGRVADVDLTWNDGTK